MRNAPTWTICFALLVFSAANPASAVDANPREFGFDIPSGRLERGEGKRVLTSDTDQHPVVAKVYVKVGENFIVLLPDGQLVGRSAADTTATDRRFEPLTTDAMLKSLATGPFADFRNKKTKHYVYLYNTSENFALATSRILESMIPGLLTHARSQKIETRDPEVPLAAIMFRTEAEFQNYRRMPPGVVAYYHVATNQIVMYEESDLWRIKPDLAIQESISTIAHEGAHQILHNIGVQQRLSKWPMWLSEGIAEYYAPTSFGKNLRWKGAGQVNDMRMFNLELFLKGRDLKTPGGQMIEHTVVAARLTSTGYASAWALTHFLARTQKDDFNAYMREVSRLGPFEQSGTVVEPGIVPENIVLFKQHFGDDYAQLEAGLVKHLLGLPYNDPFGEWPHYVAAIEVGAGRRPRREAVLFHSQSMAQKWIVDFIAELPADQRSSVQHDIRPFPNRVVASQFARQFLGTGR